TFDQSVVVSYYKRKRHHEVLENRPVHWLRAPQARQAQSPTTRAGRTNARLPKSRRAHPSRARRRRGRDSGQHLLLGAFRKTPTLRRPPETRGSPRRLRQRFARTHFGQSKAATIADPSRTSQS